MQPVPPIIATGIYFIENRGTGTVLDLEGGSTTDGTGTQGFHKRQLSDPWVPPQLWIVNQVGPQTYTIENAMGRTFLTLIDAADGTPVECFHENSSAQQKWVISRNLSGNAYVIRNVDTGTYVDLQDGGIADGTPVNGWSGSGVGTTNSHQLWVFIRAS